MRSAASSDSVLAKYVAPAFFGGPLTLAVEGGRLEQQTSVDAGAFGHDLVYGFEATRTRLAEVRDGTQTSVATGAVTNVILGEVFPLRDMPLTDVTEVGVFVQDEIGPREGRWTLSSRRLPGAPAAATDQRPPRKVHPLSIARQAARVGRCAGGPSGRIL